VIGQLNRFGAEGWEMVSVIRTQVEENLAMFTVFFKSPSSER